MNTNNSYPQISFGPDVLGSAEQDALEAKTCENCEHKCDKLDRHEECCECRDTSKYSGMKMNGGMAYCDTCRENSNRQAEAAHERFLEAYYGGEVSTQQEQYEKAAEEKRRLR